MSPLLLLYYIAAVGGGLFVCFLLALVAWAAWLVMVGALRSEK